jgi:hypothetical protein
MLDTTTGEIVNLTLMHEGNEVREFYSQLPRPVLVGIEATGSMQWFLNLMDELGIECRVGHPAMIRAAAPRKQKNDRFDADLILKLVAENRFPAIWRPSKELLDLRALLLHRHQWVRIRTRIQNALQAIALANGLRRGPGLWSYDGQAKIAFLPLLPHNAYRRSALQAMYKNMEEEIENLTQQVTGQCLAVREPLCIAQEYVGRQRRDRPPLPGVSSWGSSRGNTPVGNGSGSVESRNKAVRCCGFSGVKLVPMRYAVIWS